MKFGTAILFLGTLAASTGAAMSDELEIAARCPWTHESFERNVDAAALDSQKNAVATLKKLLNKYRGTAQEASLLERLADVEQQTAAIEFRVAHGDDLKKGRSADLSGYTNLLRDSIDTLKQLIAKYPQSTDLAHAHAMLGRAYEETGAKALAEHEYLTIVQNIPQSEESSPAYMALAEMATSENDNNRVLRYLSEIERRPEDPRYPFALYKMAWAHYNLKSVDKALHYLEKTSAYYEGKSRKGSQSPDASDQALRENALLDVPLFYVEGLEQRSPRYSNSGALRYFRSVDRGPILGRMIARYAKLLRSHGLADDLMSFKTDVIRNSSDPQEAFDVIAIAYEDQLNHRRLDLLVATSQEMSDLLLKNGSRRDLAERAQKQLLDASAVVQALIVKNKDATNVGELNSALTGIYGAFTRLVPESDPRVAKVHYNLAESLFETRHYEKATENYRWVVTRAPQSQFAQEAEQKAIASRYEELRAKNLIPKDLKARPLASDPVAPEMPDPLREWLGWVDARHASSASGTTNDSFYFEATRCLYAAGSVRAAVARLNDFATRKPLSSFAIPAASLVVDTAVASGDWGGVRQLVSRYASTPAWKGSQFLEKLHKLDSEVGYKLLESSYSSKQYGSALSQAEDFIKAHPTSPFSNEALALAGNSALAIHDRKKALNYLSKLIQQAPQSEAAAHALLSRAKLREELFDFGGAAQDDLTWLAFKPELTRGLESERSQLRSRALLLAWASGNSVLLSKVLQDAHVCTASNEDLCDRYRALLDFLSANRGKDLTKHAFASARKGADENKALWAALALEGAEHLVFRDRNTILQQVVSHWSALDPLIQAFLLPSISKSIPEAFRMNRLGVKEVAPLVTNEHYLTYRVDIIKEFETIATKTSKLPWARIRSVALSEVATTYLDFARGLRSIAVKKEGSSSKELEHFLIPFEEKGQQLRAQAFQLAADSAIEDEDLETISKPFIQDNPSQAQLLARDHVRKPRTLDLSELDLFDAGSRWSELRSASMSSCFEPQDCLRARFAQAIQQKQWAGLVVLLHEAREKKLISQSRLGLMRAVAFTAMGAQAEGLQELTDVAGSSDPQSRQKMLWVLLAHYFRSNSRAKTGEILKALRASGALTGAGAEEETLTLSNAAAKWIGG